MALLARIAQASHPHRAVALRIIFGLQERPRQSGGLKDAHSGILTLPGLPRWWDIQAERGNVLCDDFGDAVLRGAFEILETVEHLRTRIGADRYAAALGKLQCLAIKGANAWRTARAGLAGVLDDEHIGSMQCEERVDVLEAARRSISALQLGRTPVDRRGPLL